jgi:hypothetical protein
MMSDLLPSVIENAGSYREVLSAWVGKKKRVGGGRALVRLLKLSPATVTRILSGTQDISKDLLYKFCVSNQMSFEQTGFMLSLWDWETAGDPGLKSRLQGEVENNRKKLFATRSITGEEDLERAASLFVASRWEVDAILTALKVPRLRDTKAMAKRMGLDEPTVLDVISQLERFGLVARDAKGEFQPNRKFNIVDDPAISRMLIKSWSARAAARPVRAGAKQRGAANYEGLSVVALTEEKARELKSKLRATFQEVISSAQNTKDPTALYCYMVQVFEILNPD